MPDSMTAPSSAVRRLELTSTVLLALATVATAWAAYQSRQWTGQQALATSRATAARIAENRAAALANRQVQIDVATFIQWLDARQQRDPRLADFYRTRFGPSSSPRSRAGSRRGHSRTRRPHPRRSPRRSTA